MYELFEKEKAIMEIFWNSEQPLLISEILKADPSLSRNTVAKSLVKLEQKGYLKVDSIRRTATRTGRAYVPVISQKEYSLQEEHTKAMLESTATLSDCALLLCSNLLRAGQVDNHFITELEKMIQDYKNK